MMTNKTTILTTKPKKQKKQKKHMLKGALLALSLSVFMPIQAFAKNSKDIQSSVNTAGEGVYDFVAGIAFWIAVAMVALGFLVMKFGWLDRSGKGGKIILSSLFGIAGIFAAPQIVTFVMNLVK